MIEVNRVPGYVAILTLSALTIFSCDSRKEIKRPLDPWVFRSVLDQKPRMVTAALHDNLYVAYDARQCQLYKAWKGGVIFDQLIYDNELIINAAETPAYENKDNKTGFKRTFKLSDVHQSSGGNGL